MYIISGTAQGRIENELISQVLASFSRKIEAIPLMILSLRWFLSKNLSNFIIPFSSKKKCTTYSDEGFYEDPGAL